MAEKSHSNPYETTLLAAYEISAENDHDVYDSFIVALSREYDADYTGRQRP